MILTDDKGRPFERPKREDFVLLCDYLRAEWAYRDAIARCANTSFAEGFARGMARYERDRALGRLR